VFEILNFRQINSTKLLVSDFAFLNRKIGKLW